jgi:CheY-like chemotaxis protein
VVLSSDRPFVAFVRAVVAEAAISVCGSQQWEAGDDLILDRRPSLVALDLSVGQHYRCWATLERMARDPRLRSIPVVVCATASWLLDGHADALARNGVHVWREPFDPAALLDTVDAAIQTTTIAGARRATDLT